MINPGGSDGVDNFTSEKLLTIQAPSAAVITGTAALNLALQEGAATSNSIGMQNIRLVNGLTAASPVTARIKGSNFGRVSSLSFGTAQMAIGPSNITSNGTRIEVSVPSFCVTGAQSSVTVQVYDGVNPQVSFANGWIYTTTGPIQVFIPGYTGFGVNAVVYVVGQCEHLNVGVTSWTVPSIGEGFLDTQGCDFNNPLNASCARILWTFSEKMGLSTVFPNANFGLFTWTTSCANCGGGGGSGYFLLDATNTNSNTRAPSLCRSTSCN